MCPIHLIPKWPLFRYSFVFIQIRPWCLVQGKISFWIFSSRTRHQGLIWIKTKEYLNDGHFGIKSMTPGAQEVDLARMRSCNNIAWTRPNENNNMQHQILQEKFDRFQIWSNINQRVAKYRNRVAKCTQHGCCAQQWMLQDVALKCCERLTRSKR